MGVSLSLLHATKREATESAAIRSLDMIPYGILTHLRWSLPRNAMWGNSGGTGAHSDEAKGWGDHGPPHRRPNQAPSTLQHPSMQ